MRTSTPTAQLARRMADLHWELSREGYDGSQHHTVRWHYWSALAIDTERAERDAATFRHG